MRREALAALSLLLLTALAAVFQPDDRTSPDFCRRAGVIWDTSQIVDTPVGRLLTAQPRPSCDSRGTREYGADLWNEGVDGVLFQDCVVEWVSRKSADASDLGLDCHDGRLR